MDRVSRVERNRFAVGAARRSCRAVGELRALLHADLDVALDLPLLLLGNQRPHARRVVERIADHDVLRALDELLDEAVVDLVLDEVVQISG
jgi:hypothetical protein